MKLTCTKCGYSWDWHGKRKYATCPSCFNVYVKIPENITKKNQNKGNNNG